MKVINFWEIKSLKEMNKTEWESLCDGCGYCCLHKLQDEEDDKIYLTRIACDLLDLETCQCTDYPNRLKKVSICQQIKPDIIMDLPWLPSTCAYRCLAEGRPLPTWHPLVCQHKNSVLEDGRSIKTFAVSESYIHPEQWQECIIDEL